MPTIELKVLPGKLVWWFNPTVPTTVCPTCHKESALTDQKPEMRLRKDVVLFVNHGLGHIRYCVRGEMLPAERIFLTRAEAEAEAKRRNESDV